RAAAEDHGRAALRVAAVRRSAMSASTSERTGAGRKSARAEAGRPARSRMLATPANGNESGSGGTIVRFRARFGIARSPSGRFGCCCCFGRGLREPQAPLLRSGCRRGRRSSGHRLLGLGTEGADLGFPVAPVAAGRLLGFEKAESAPAAQAPLRDAPQLGRLSGRKQLVLVALGGGVQPREGTQSATCRAGRRQPRPPRLR